jgi:hypothetical protein
MPLSAGLSNDREQALRTYVYNTRHTIKVAVGVCVSTPEHFLLELRTVRTCAAHGAAHVRAAPAP